jgi:hypothetical protein
MPRPPRPGPAVAVPAPQAADQVGQARGRVPPGEAAGAAGRPGQCGGFAEERREPFAQALRRELGLGHQPSAAGLGEGPGVGGLMVVGGCGKRHQDRRPAGGGQLRHGGRAGPADHQVGVRQALGHVVEEGGEGGRQAAAPVGRFHCRHRAARHLLADREAPAQVLGQAAERGRDQVVEGLGALAAAEHQQPERVARSRRAVGPPAALGDGRPHWVAGHHHLGSLRRGDALDLGEPGGDRMGPRRQQAVGPAQHRVLLVQHHAQAKAGAGQGGGHRGVAAETDHGVGRQPPQEPACLEIAQGEAGRALRLLGQAAAGDAPGGDPVGLDLGEFGAEPGAALVGDQDRLDAPGDQLPGQGLGREQVAAGAAGRQDHTLGTGICHGGAGHDSSPVPTRRRVKASTMPIPTARAMSEEPP